MCMFNCHFRCIFPLICLLDSIPIPCLKISFFPLFVLAFNMAFSLLREEILQASFCLVNFTALFSIYIIIFKINWNEIKKLYLLGYAEYSKCNNNFVICKILYKCFIFFFILGSIHDLNTYFQFRTISLVLFSPPTSFANLLIKSRTLFSWRSEIDLNDFDLKELLFFDGASLPT